MRTVYKFEIMLEDDVFVPMPDGAEILCVGRQAGGIFAWAMVDTAKPIVSRHFAVRGMGHDLDERCTKQSYIGTVFAPPFVWHVFEKGSG